MHQIKCTVIVIAYLNGSSLGLFQFPIKNQINMLSAILKAENNLYSLPEMKIMMIKTRGIIKYTELSTIEF